MCDRCFAYIRQGYVERGVITPSWFAYRSGERPPMSREAVLQYKQSLIKQGLLVPKEMRDAPVIQPKRRIYDAEGLAV